MAAGDPDELEAQAREAIAHLASFERGSASEGEHRAARWIASRLDALGAPAVVERESAHGGYWWPLGLLTLVAGLASITRSQLAWLLAGGGAAALVADDVSGGPKLLRRLLPRRPTWNVVAVAGDPDAERTVVVVAHHDAAHWSLLFSPAVPEFFGRRFPGSLEKADTTPPVMFPVFAGPLAVFLAGFTGSGLLRRLGSVLSLGAAAVFAEIGSRSVVPGGNDNLSGVAAVLGLASSLRARPVSGVRVLLVSTGSEESFMEGMQAFGRRHFPDLPRESTSFICVDTVGSPTLMELEGEGMLVMRDYPAQLKDLLSRAARDEGIELVRGLRFRNATDGLISMRAGYPTVMLGSITEYKAPANYHWPSDTAENVDYGTVVDATLLCRRAIDLIAEEG
ncbi:MAG: M28 family peptidase [Solirubrobacterales bacterium]